MADLAGANGQRENFRVVGKPNLPGVLSYALATGVARFGIDYVLPDMLHAKFLRSPYANARVLRVDTAKARAIPGVVDILTWEDEDIKKLVSYGEHWGAPRPWLDNLADQEGAEVAVIVVAETEELCEEALRQLDVEWEVLPHIVDILKGRKADAPVIRPQDRSTPHFGAPDPNAPPNPPKEGNVAYSNVVQGDIEEGFKQADHIMEYDMYMPAFASHVPNPPGSVAWWSKDSYSGEDEVLHIEGAVRERLPISQMYDTPLDNVVQEGLFMGGRYCDWGLRRSQEITPLLAKRTGRPVRCVLTREQTFDSVIMKQRYMHLKVGFTKEGLITAVDDFSVSDAGTWGSSSFGHVGDQKQGPYNTLKCKNISQRMEIVDSNRHMMWVSGQHTPFNWDIVTIALYMISEKLGMDPIEVARLNLHGPTSKDDRDPVPSFEACVAAGKKMMDWDWHPSNAKTLPDGRKHGMSFRYQMCPRHSVSGYVCRLEFRDGVVHMPTQGPLFGAYMVEPNAMVVAEELGLEYEDVKVDFNYRAKFSPVGGGSDGSTASSWAMKECANILKKQILEAAVEYAESWPLILMAPLQGMPLPEPGPFKGCKPEDLDIMDGKIFVKADPERSAPLAQATNRELVATYSGRPPLSAWLVGGCGNILDTMNTVYCEVAVDTETGEVEILRFGAVVDPGKALRPTSLESQIDQVMFFSQGSQLLEDVVYDARTGVKLNSNMIDYKKPTMMDVPTVEHELLETRSGNGAYGANGISHSMANTHLVITAIHNAIGVWVDPPATPDKVLKALGKA
ncbi:CO or xanthine dehydrogenase, Mo-binding subunit [Sporobacter termitidis DSM 10068]|uniref:CO or xanthine dehydrogenase, Mo-binding subunit n=1 Tax=Sporobacter termitidis DSM 10068 TaxID=1123282 RepID=A0A1M5YXN1_9FIRM|nr:molybdopterin cofactor-binding domain-containing protein [Sporobacter termitidis]SHI16797.1 CO or xanthine dehydrogenase, Mo-binding subunit [Sporobacter termitidis DSM 10068]